jgi:hypothetical protein
MLGYGKKIMIIDPATIAASAIAKVAFDEIWRWGGCEEDGGGCGGVGQDPARSN